MRTAVGPAGSREGADGSHYTIGDLAREFGVTTRAIRFYEDRGLLTPQRQGRNRVYSPRDHRRLSLTLRGKRLGLSLAEVKAVVDMYEAPRDTPAQLRSYLVALGSHRAQLERQAADLRVALDEVRRHEKDAHRVVKTGHEPPAQDKR